MPLKEITCARESNNGILSRRFYCDRIALQIWQQEATDDEVCAFEMTIRSKADQPFVVRWLASRGFSDPDGNGSDTSRLNPNKLSALFESEAIKLDIWLCCFIESKLKQFNRQPQATAA